MSGRTLGAFALIFLVTASFFMPSSWLPSFPGSQSSAPEKKAKKAEPPAPVQVATAVERTVPIYLDGVGTVKARSTVAVKSRIEGQLFEALVREGQTVSRGDELFRLDPRPLKARLKETEAILARDRANHAKAVADVARLTGLSAKGYSPKVLLEDTLTLVDTFAATVRATEAVVELAKLNLDYTIIRSPIDGRVGSILITPGNIVAPNDAQPLLVITEIKPVYVSFGVPEKFVDELRRRMATDRLTVDVSTQADAKAAASGKLFFINNEVDPSTGTIQLQATFDNENERLTPGQFVRARILLSTLDNAVLAPSRAIQINQKGQFIWVVNTDNSIELRAVATGIDDGGDTVITSGLKAGETVVTDGQLRLVPGITVETQSDREKNEAKLKAPS